MRSSQPDDLHPFLLLLDGLVLRDAAVAGLGGEICVGVRTGDSVAWWRAIFDRTIDTQFLAERSPTANATWLIPGAESVKLVQGKGFDAGRCYLEGDRDLFERFIRRYTTQMSVLGLRVRNAKEGR